MPKPMPREPPVIRAILGMMFWNHEIHEKEFELLAHGTHGIHGKIGPRAKARGYGNVADFRVFCVFRGHSVWFSGDSYISWFLF
jgi:hypothetical protein